MKVCDFRSPVEHSVFRVLRADLPLIVEVRCEKHLLYCGWVCFRFCSIHHPSFRLQDSFLDIDRKWTMNVTLMINKFVVYRVHVTSFKAPG